MAKIQKNRYWGFICYPESLPDDWIQLLTETGLPIAISPLHNKDVNENDEIKKAHYHVLLAWDGPTTANVADQIAHSVNGTNCKPIASVKGMYDYHIHKNNPEKFQYDDSQRILLNGFNIFNYAAMTTEEDVLIKKQILDFIVANDIDEYFILLNKLQHEDLVAFDYASKHTVLFNAYITSRRHYFSSQVTKILSKKDSDE